jgi:hypothetical protein
MQPIFFLSLGLSNTRVGAGTRIAVRLQLLIHIKLFDSFASAVATIPPKLHCSFFRTLCFFCVSTFYTVRHSWGKWQWQIVLWRPCEKNSKFCSEKISKKKQSSFSDLVLWYIFCQYCSTNQGHSYKLLIASKKKYICIRWSIWPKNNRLTNCYMCGYIVKVCCFCAGPSAHIIYNFMLHCEKDLLF